ncbi:MAG: hypothetical protein O3A47_09495 [Chloroflexi bacterium]|nr:hypothetical protein [Chloroflexota bacterium]
MVKGFIASLKMALTDALSATPVAALAGTVELTIGAVVSGIAVVEGTGVAVERDVAVAVGRGVAVAVERDVAVAVGTRMTGVAVVVRRGIAVAVGAGVGVGVSLEQANTTVMASIINRDRESQRMIFLFISNVLR